MKSTYLFVLSIFLGIAISSCGGYSTNKQQTDQDSTAVSNSTDAIPDGKSSKISVSDMVGIWDYYAESDPSNKIEIIFKKDGTLIDYIDFHSTGTYKVNEDGTITMQFFYNDGSTSQKSKPFTYKVLEYSKDCFKIIYDGEGGNVVIYDRKAKSDNYDGKLEL